MRKAEQVAEQLESASAQAAPGQWVGSVASLGELCEVSTGTVLAGVDIATGRGLLLERRRGPAGGYYRPKGGPMPSRWLTLQIHEDIGLDTYADLAHALWSAARLAIPHGEFEIEHDGQHTNKQLNDRWDRHSAVAPWR